MRRIYIYNFEELSKFANCAALIGFQLENSSLACTLHL